MFSGTMARNQDPRRVTLSWVALAVLAGVLLCRCDGPGEGADEGGALRGRWSGSFVCLDQPAYTMSCYLDGEGTVTGVSLRSRFLFSMCPGGPGHISCGGDGTYTYEKSGSRFRIEVGFSGCKCGYVNVDFPKREVLSGTFDG